MESISKVLNTVMEAGEIGIEFQKEINFGDRDYKEDGSILTKADTRIEDFLCNEIQKLVPECNFITEERSRSFSEDLDFTFVIDPIDGTDNYSNGIPSWCISVGLLDENLAPIGGIVYAPRLDLIFFADIGEAAKLGDSTLDPGKHETEISGLSSIFMSSRVHRQLEMDQYPGKIRAFGSAAIHLCMPAAYPSVIGTIQDDRAYIWDIAGAHAILSSLDCDICYFDGKTIDYRDIREDNWKVKDYIIAGKPNSAIKLQKYFARIE